MESSTSDFLHGVGAAPSSPSSPPTTSKSDFSGLNMTSGDNSSTLVGSLCGINISHEVCMAMLPQYVMPRPYEWFLIFMYFIVFVIGLTGNFLVVFVVWKNNHMKTITNLFIVNLSLGDFMVILICLPTTVLTDVTETWFLGAVLCRLVHYLQAVSISVSVLTLTVISIERFYAIVHPLYFHATLTRARVMIGLIWLISLIIMIPDLVVLDVYEFHPDTHLLVTCRPSWSYTSQMVFQLFIIGALYFVPVVLMGFAYIRIALCLWSDGIPTESYDRPLTASGRPNTEVRQQVSARRTVAKMLIAVVITFAVCYLPVHLLNILRYAGVLLAVDNTSIYFALVAHWLCYFNSAINPVIYNFMSTKFRKQFRIACWCLPWCEEKRSRRPPPQDRTYSYRYSNSHVTQSEHVMMNTLANTHTIKEEDF